MPRRNSSCPRYTAAVAGKAAPERTASRQRGFTIIEMTVSLVVMMEIVLGALLVFDFNSKLSHVQEQVSDMQQSLRIGQYELVRFVRGAGRGGLGVTSPARTWPLAVAVETRNNVTAANNQIAIGNAGSPTVMTGTDVLIVRGVFSGAILSLDNSQAGTMVLLNAAGNPAASPTVATQGTVQVCATSPFGVSQDLSTLSTDLANGIPEALVLRSATDPSVYSVVELSGGTATSALCTAKGLTGLTLNFKTTGDPYANAYQKLSPVTVDAGKNPTQDMPPLMNSALTLGIVEEYRYYVRQEYIIPGDAQSAIAPRLSRARFYPGTELAYNGDPNNLQVDIAENVLDLQVALGLDVNNDGVITDNSSATDEYLYNNAGDNVTQAGWTDVQPAAVPAVLTPLLYVRINLLARTSRQDTQYVAPLITQIEDHAYNTAPPPWSTAEPNSNPNRMYRRRLLQTVVGPRGAV